MAEQPNQRQWNNNISELPAFYGNDKDTISADSLLLRVEGPATALGLDNKAIFNNFSLCLRADAKGWRQLCRLFLEVRNVKFPNFYLFIITYFESNLNLISQKKFEFMNLSHFFK
jgi:hypothetical protein